MNYLIEMLRRIFVFLSLLWSLTLVACQNDGRVVSENILNAVAPDSAFVACELASLDSMISPEIFGRDFGRAMVEYIEQNDSVDVSALNNKVALVREVYAALGGANKSARVVEGIMSYENGLPLDRRMKLYAGIATPEQLGTALRIDKYSASADSALIEAQINTLRVIYTDEQWAQFMEYYNRK